MDIRFKSITRLVEFLENIGKEAYPEQPAKHHTQITEQAFNYLFDNYPIPAEALVLDVGCGQGPALGLFRNKGCRAVGITLNDVDIQACREKGYNVLKMGQSFLEFPDDFFDVVWARHVIEHSIFPYFTLTEYWRVLKQGGALYVEVPAPETVFRHETNPNHYSVLGNTMWLSLFERSGFETREAKKYFLKSEFGSEEYWGFFNIKK